MKLKDLAKSVTMWGAVRVTLFDDLSMDNAKDEKTIYVDYDQDFDNPRLLTMLPEGWGEFIALEMSATDDVLNIWIYEEEE